MILVSSGLPKVLDEANPTHELGAKVYLSNGNAYRYVKAGASALVAGTVVQSRPEDTGEQSLLVTATPVGAKEVTTADTVTVTANQYAGGLLVTTGEGGTGNGLAYRIKSHPAATGAVVTLTLEEPIQVALTSATQVDLVPNLYDGVIINPTTASGPVVGVAVNDISANQYGWVQTDGVGVVKTDASGAVTVGSIVTASNQTAGCVEDGDTDTQAIVGVAVTGIAQGEYGAVKLSIG